MKTLFAGPFEGEFGYELFEWQGKIRRLSKNYDKTIICSRKGHELLYQDFCHEFIPIESPYDGCSEFNNPNSVTNADSIIKNNDLCVDDVVTPHQLGSVKYNKKKRRKKFDLSKQDFVKYGIKKEDLNYDFVVHARAFKGNKGKRNWDQDKWNELISFFKDKKVCSIGITGVAYYIENTENKLDISIKKLSNILASSKFIVGPSSGPMHLATLCGCKQVVWSSMKNYEDVFFGLILMMGVFDI
jgi:hypothetical protein